MYLDITIFRCIAKAMDLKKPKRLIIWKEGSKNKVLARLLSKIYLDILTLELELGCH